MKHQQEGDGPIIVILYVDDITTLGSSLVAVDYLKDQIAKRYKVTDLGSIESYLGVKFRLLQIRWLGVAICNDPSHHPYFFLNKSSCCLP